MEIKEFVQKYQDTISVKYIEFFSEYPVFFMQPQNLAAIAITSSGIIPALQQLIPTVTKGILLSELTAFIRNKFKGKNNKQIESQVKSLGKGDLDKLTFEISRIIEKTIQENDYDKEFISNFKEEILSNNKTASALDEINKKLSGIQTNTQQIGLELQDFKHSAEANFASIRQELTGLPKINHFNREIIDSYLYSEHKAQLSLARDFLFEYKAAEALRILNKLKKRVWDTAKSEIKFGILTNIGSANLIKQEETKAAKLFIEALQFKKSDEKALCNAALGYLLLGNMQKSKDLAQQALELNPSSSRAYSIIIQTHPETKPIEEIIDLVPKELRDSGEIANAIGTLYIKREKLEEAEIWLKKAVKEFKGNLSVVGATLGDIILNQVLKDESLMYGNAPNPKQKKRIKEAIKLINKSLEDLSGLKRKDYRIHLLFNKSLGEEVLGNYDSADEDLNKALLIDPSNISLIERKGILAYKRKDYKNAESLLKKAIKSKKTSYTAIILSNALRLETKYEEALKILNELLEQNIRKNLKKEAYELQFEIYLNIGEHEEARKVIGSLKKLKVSHRIILLKEAKLLESQKKNNEALKKLEHVFKEINPNIPFKQMLELANILYSFGQYEKATEVYKIIYKDRLESTDIPKVLNCYYKSGELKLALGIARKLRLENGPLENITEFEIVINEEIGAYSEAIKICKEFLNVYPNSIEIKLRLAGINLRSQNFKELDDFLNSSIDYEILSFDQGTFLADLYRVRDQKNKMLNLSYEIIRKFFNEVKAHKFYFSRFLLIPYKSKKHQKVLVDSAVCTQDSLGNEKWYIIENRNNYDLSRGELNLSSPVAKALLNKKIGDKINIGATGKPVKIRSIESKFEHAFKVSSEFLRNEFPKQPDFEFIEVGFPDENGKINYDFTDLLKKTEKLETRRKKILDLYKKEIIPISTISSLLGSNIYDVINSLCKEIDIGIRCFNGVKKDWEYSYRILEKHTPIFADFTSLITMHKLNIGDKILNKLGKVGVAQSSRDLINMLIDEKECLKGQNEDIKELKRLMLWIDKNCKILPCKYVLNMKKKEKQKIEETIGKSFLNTILIAKEKKGVLYSDDNALRFLAKYQFEVDGIWTQALLNYGLKDSIIGQDIYNKKTTKLASLLYYHTSINADILMEAAKEANWNPTEPYELVLEMLKGSQSDENSALLVSSNFLYKLSLESIEELKFNNLVMKLLQILLKDRNKLRTIEKLKFIIKKRFLMIPQLRDRVISTVDAYYKNLLLV